MTPWLVDVPQTRTAPEAIRASLRALDPTAEVLSLGWGQWVMGRVRPTDESVRIATRMLATYWQMEPRARASKRGVQRYRLAHAGRQGFRPMMQYTLRDLDSRIVRDFQRAQWRMQHEREDLFDAMERAGAEEQAQRRAMLGDLDAAKDVVNYVTHSNFGYAVSSVARPTHTPSGRTLIRTA